MEVERFLKRVKTRAEAERVTRGWPCPFHREFRTFELHLLAPNMWPPIDTYHLVDERTALYLVNKVRTMLGEKPAVMNIPSDPEPLEAAGE